MSGSFIRFRIRDIIIYVATMIVVLAIGAVARSMANDAASGLEGPAFAMEADHAAPSDETAQPELVAPAKDSPQSEKSTKSEKTVVSEKVSGADVPATKSEIKSETKAEAQKDNDVAKKDEGKGSEKGVKSVKSRESAKGKEGVKSAKGEEGVKSEKKQQTVGEPLAPGMIKLLQDELLDAFKRRGVNDRIARFQSYMIGRVTATAGKYTGSELTGNCRIKWYGQMMHNVIAAPAEAERFTRELHKIAANDREGLAKLLAIASVKMDAGPQKVRQYPPVTSPEQALDIIKQALTDAQVAYCAALAPLSKSEIRELQTYLVPVLTTQNHVGHTVVDRGEARPRLWLPWPTCDCSNNSNRCRPTAM
jgi:hypothetical protein